jgi:hypothetical protein
MTARRDAGKARERPRAQTTRERRPPSARAAGIAPASPAAAAAPEPQGGPHKGMISNPWVKHWTGRGPDPTEDNAAKGRARKPTAAKTTPNAKPAAKGKPRAEAAKPPRPGSVNAGAAPRRARMKP